MSDNTPIDPGTGPSLEYVADEDIAGVKYQRVKLIDPTVASTAPIGVAANPMVVSAVGAGTEVTLAALKLAVETLSAKIAACNTGSVTLDSATLAALEHISVDNFPATQPVSATALPLPAGASTEATLLTAKTALTNIDSKTPALSAGRVPVELPAGGSGLTDNELRATAVPVADAVSANFLWRIMQLLMAPLGYDKSLQRQRATVVVETLPTLATVTAVTGITNPVPLGNLASIDGRNAAMLINAQSRTSWALNVRSRIT